uniref:Glutamate rich 2 n=1 Tax=Felis catus TaxID=9685 RepID=A0ABI7YU00_FELCA
FPLPLYPVLDWLSFLSLASQAWRGPVLSHLPRPAPSTAPRVRPASFLALSGSPTSSRPRPSPSASLSRNQGSGRAGSRLHGDAVCTAPSSEHRANPELGWPSVSAPRKGGVKEPRAGQVGKDAVLQEQEKNNKRCLQGIDDKLSELTDDDGEDDTSDDDNDEDSHPNKDTHAPLELMAEFLRAEMGQDYHLAKKLCQMILIYEPENPEAKEFFSLIEEMLLIEKSQNLEEDDEDSEEDSSSESEGESSEELSEESSDECEDG